MKRICILALSTLLVLSLFACGSKDASTQTGTSTASATIETAAETVPETTGPLASYLPEKDLKGFELHVAMTEGRGPNITSEELNGDILNDAVFESVGIVADAYNSKIVPIFYGKNTGDVKGRTESRSFGRRFL